MIARGILYLFISFISFSSSAQQNILDESGIDSLMAIEDSIQKSIDDSLLIEERNNKLKNEMQRADSFIVFSFNLNDWMKKNFASRYDIQQRRETQSSLNMFIALMLMLLVLTYLKLAFANDLEELWFSVSSTNRAVQIFRTQTDTISASSFLLTANFVLSSTLFIQLSLQNISPSHAVQSRITTIYLIILFTSFLLIRTLVLRIIGFAFSLSNITSMYEFHFVRIAQTLGLTLLPAVLFIYALDEKFFVLFFVLGCLMCCVALVMLVLRGLSTSSKVILSSIKYFFIYVCVGEVALAFFFSKLLTKIVF